METAAPVLTKPGVYYPDWQAAERKGEPGGLYEPGGKLWKSSTEVDALIARRGAGGRWRPLELEQMKTGNRDSHTKAQAQNTHALNAMQEIANGSNEVRLFDRTGKNTLSKELTPQFDLSTPQNVNTATRGLQGKEGFDRNIPFLRETLQEVAQGLVEHGLPPTPAPVRPVTVGPSTERGAPK